MPRGWVKEQSVGQARWWDTAPESFDEPRACPEFIEGTNGGAVDIFVDLPFSRVETEDKHAIHCNCTERRSDRWKHWNRREIFRGEI